MVKRGLATASVLLCGVVTACSAGPSRAAAPVTGPEVVVASFNFPESELLAEIYGQALEHAGVRVRLQLNLGPREMVLPALHQGMVDIVPEYLGSALAAMIPSAPSELLSGTLPQTLATDLANSLVPWHVRPLQWAAAQDQNGLAVTRDTATRLALHNVSDLAPFATTLVLSGPTECPNRPFCLVGFEHQYGLHFKSFMAYDAESQRVTALRQRVADVAVLFTTDGQLASGDPVLLADDRHLQPPENVIPLVSEKAIAAYGARLVDAMNAVSAKLTTASLVELNSHVSLAGRPIAGEATAWLQQEGLIPRPGPGRK